MATACESDDCEMNQEITSVSPVRPFTLQSFSPKTLCCASTTSCTYGMTAALVQDELPINSNSQDSNTSQGLSTIVPLLSEYYNYIETIQREIKASRVTVDELKESIQHVPCMIDSQIKYTLFETLPTDSIDKLMSFLKDHSSWYNHNLFTQIAKRHSSTQQLTQEYIDTLTQHCSKLLLLLPAVSTGPNLPRESFEELKVFTRQSPDMYTLGDSIQLQESLCDILGLTNYVMLLQGLSTNHTGGSVFTYWIPQSVGSQVISNGADNVEKLQHIGVTRVEGSYNTVILVQGNEVTAQSTTFIKSLHRLQTVDSGYADNQMFGSSDFLNSSSPTYCDTNLTLTVSSTVEDDVFITQISPDSSSTAQCSTNDISSFSTDDSCSKDDSSTLGRGTPLLSPPPDYADNITVQVIPSVAANCDSEILMEIERQSLTSPNDGKPPAVRTVSNESTYIRMGPAHATHTSSPLRAQIVTATPSEGQRSFNGTNNKEYHYKITLPHESNGFVKRVLMRSCARWPANLHVVCISNHNDTKNGISYKVGQKLVAQCLYGNDVAVNVSGRIPYDSIRVSKSYYGDNSKTFQLTYCQLYSLSTLNVHIITDTQDEFRQISRVEIDLIVIKRYNSRSKDELTVGVGDAVRLLYCDDSWVYCSTGRTSGFIPRSHCRLTRHCWNVLKLSGWCMSKYQFQADFKFNANLAPPEILLENPHLPLSAAKDEIRTLLRNYVVPGSQYIVRRGASVKTRYYEQGGFFRFVATITGTSFWVPSAFTVAPPTLPILPITMTTRGCKLRPHAHTISGSQGEGVAYRKKVSFAKGSQLAIIQSVRSSLCQSNPELSLTDNEPQYATITTPIPSTIRSQSTEHIPFYFNCNSPTNTCCSFLCF